MSTPLVGFDATATQRPRSADGRAALEMLRALVAHEDDPPRLRVYFSGPWGARGPEHAFLDAAPGVQVVTGLRPRDWLAAAWRAGGGPDLDAALGADVSIVVAPAGVVAPGRRAKHVAMVSEIEANNSPAMARLATAERLIVPLETMRHALVDGGIEPPRIEVLPPAIDPSTFFVENERLVETVRHDLAILVPSFLMAVSGHGPGERRGLMLDAYATLRERQPATPPLVVTGWGGRIPDDLKARPGLHRHVLPVEPKDEVVLRSALTGAVATLCTATGPMMRRAVLEAQACGSPVVAADDASARELLRDSALLVSGERLGGWADALESVVFNRPRRAEFKQRGIANAARFSWAPAVERLMQVWRGM